jgi:hypothetical protein
MILRISNFSSGCYRKKKKKVLKITSVLAFGRRRIQARWKDSVKGMVRFIRKRICF